MKIFGFFFAFILCSASLNGQPVPDTAFSFEIAVPAYEKGTGPTICIDSAHNNLHTKNGGFAPFAKVVREDGYKVTGLSSEVTDSNYLKDCNIYLIVNPLHGSNIRNWVLPNPSAFTTQEIETINSWVEQGGSLFLIADHMPFAGAASELGLSFGFNFSNGFASLEKERGQPDVFSLSNGRLKKSPVTREDVNSVTSFTGSAFTFPEEAIPVIVFQRGDYSMEPEVAWQFEENTDTLDLEGYAQGALMDHGKGKLAVFGEAAMFTAQNVNTDQGVFKVGLHSELAPQNIQFLLNLVHWLDGKE